MWCWFVAGANVPAANVARFSLSETEMVMRQAGQSEGSLPWLALGVTVFKKSRNCRICDNAW